MLFSKYLAGAVAFAVVGLGPVALVHAQKAGTDSDAMFVQKASQGGLAEVQLGRLAEHKASKQAVKDFGKRMVTDHSKANMELTNVASEEKLPMASAPEAEDKALYDKLSAMSGAEFDRAYMDAMVQDHQKDIAEFQKEATSGTDPKVKDFAAKTLPTLKEHLALAERARDGV